MFDEIYTVININALSWVDIAYIKDPKQE